MGILDNRPVLHIDANGNPYAGGEYYHLSANTTGTLVDGSPTYLHRINVNKAGSSDWAITVYDGTSTSGNVVAILDASTKGSYELGAHLSTGLYVVASGTTAGDVTLIYSSRNSG